MRYELIAEKKPTVPHLGQVILSITPLHEPYLGICQSKVQGIVQGFLMGIEMPSFKMHTAHMKIRKQRERERDR